LQKRRFSLQQCCSSNNHQQVLHKLINNN